eukprot:TRINITY_DN38212_c0_g1_i1.p1 TRINITY_DN38212_c0_g1~~TRINITY_DN38212_c0_g1_i1.p1  ORF type:complete len:1329 (+),score=267.67 TRINITY_DN38212_c0_g1_i1:38-4024(+)
MVVAARPPSACRDVQHVWMYCESVEEADNLHALCREASNRKEELVSQNVEVPEQPPWQQFMLSSITEAPPNYRQDQLQDAHRDLTAWLVASVSSAQQKQKQEHGGRRPCMLVTDREQLSLLASDAFYRTYLTPLVAAAGLSLVELIPVVLASNFGHVQGYVIAGEALDFHRPATLQARAAGCAASEDKLAEVASGVYLQKHKTGEDSCSSPLESTRTTWDESGAFGMRCLALFDDGRCTYSAISHDGIRGVYASGAWEVINGHVVVGGAHGDATIIHLRLGQGGVHVVEDVRYPEPVHVSLEELLHEFDPPVQFSDCVPRGADRLRLTLLDGHSLPQAVSADDISPTSQVTSIDLNSTFGTRWGRTSTPPRQRATISAASEAPGLASTPLHAVLSLASLQAISPRSAISMSDAQPRLFGVQRGLVSAAGSQVGTPLLDDVTQLGNAVERSTRADGFFEPLEKLSSGTMPLPTCQHKAQSFAMCPLKPGKYMHKLGVPNKHGYASLELILRPNGFCKMEELWNGGSVRTASAHVHWSVSEGVLRLGDGITMSFVKRELHGMRHVEREVACILLDVDAVLERCEYEPLEQQSDPFPGHVAAESERRIFGLIDPDSVALSTLKCRVDRVPCHAFERELRRHGLPCDEILSDFRFIDRDKDGQLALADIRLLNDYGDPAAPPEVIHQLREALLARFGSLDVAFEQMSDGQTSGRLDFDTFDRSLQRIAGESDSRGKPGQNSGQKLAQWMADVSAEERRAVFDSLNPQRGATIELADFLALHLYTAVFAVRRLEHFQSWLFEEFGRTADVFKKVFAALDTDKQSGGIARSTFAEAVRQLGYPCDVDAARSMFSLLDRSFRGAVSVKEFVKLCDFNADHLLKSLLELKVLADEEFGGIDECFVRLQRREQLLNDNGILPGNVSLNAFQRVLVKAGLNNRLPQSVDFRMLFLFLDAASEKPADGYMGKQEWSLLRGFDTRFLHGSPSRLRKILDKQYGGIDRAFQKMHTSWLRRALLKARQQTALALSAWALSRLSSAATPRPRSPPPVSPAAAQVRPPRARSAASSRPPRGPDRVPAVCPWCKTSFASVPQAAWHAVHSFARACSCVAQRNASQDKRPVSPFGYKKGLYDMQRSARRAESSPRKTGSFAESSADESATCDFELTQTGSLLNRPSTATAARSTNPSEASGLRGGGLAAPKRLLRPSSANPPRTAPKVQQCNRRKSDSQAIMTTSGDSLVLSTSPSCSEMRASSLPGGRMMRTSSALPGDLGRNEQAMRQQQRSRPASAMSQKASDGGPRRHRWIGVASQQPPKPLGLVGPSVLRRCSSAIDWGGA